MKREEGQSKKYLLYNGAKNNVQLPNQACSFCSGELPIFVTWLKRQFNDLDIKEVAMLLP